VFNDGRIAQVGAPSEVYEHPASEFVAGFVGTSNVLERDGRRFTVRPEKVHLHDAADAPTGDGWHVEAGHVVDTAYAGMVTRYMVELDAGDRLQVVRQNLETTSSQALEMRGRAVQVAWRLEQASAIGQDPEEGT
jgi:putative spermidine/putrescine transport system ATP-binding protein